MKILNILEEDKLNRHKNGKLFKEDELESSSKALNKLNKDLKKQ